MNKKQAKFRHDQLNKMLAQADDLYYKGEETGLSDDVYNTLFKELRDLEAEYPELINTESLTQRVGRTLDNALKKVVHSEPMISLYTEVDYTEQGAKSFQERVTNKLLEGNHAGALAMLTSNKPTVAVEAKYDGLGVRLRYRHGRFLQAITRGDGLVGEDVTHNAVHLTNIPLTFGINKEIPFTSDEIVEVCGEVMITRQMFKTINEKQAADGKPLYANTRNLAAGTIRQLDSSVALERRLVFYPYDIIAPSINNSHLKNMADLFKLGFVDTMFRSCSFNSAELYKAHQELERVRAKLDIEIDGIVYKIDDHELRKVLGFTAREPRWAVAHKYAPESAIAKVLDIDIQIGRTGKVTPVARIEPTRVGGVEVSNATLSNLSQIRKKGVHVGDEIVIQRAGDVIPEIVMVMTTVPPWEEDTRPVWQMPTHCPLCKSLITMSEDLKQAKCTGKLICPGQSLQRIIHFCGRRAMNIVGVADKTIEELLNREIIKDAGDLMGLKKEDFLKIPGIKNKLAQKMASAIVEARAPSQVRLLFALGIPTVGEVTSKELLDHFGNMYELLKATEEDLLKVPNVGPETARNVIEFFQDEDNKDLMFRLVTHGVMPRDHHRSQGGLTGLSFCVTGSFESRDRTELEQWIQVQGGKVVGSLSSKTNYLVAGDGGGGKRDKAKAIGVPILSEWELYTLLKEKEAK